MSSKSGQGRIFWGLFLVLIGLLFLLEQAGYVDVGRIIFTYWPAIFILIGLSIFISNGFKSSSEAMFLIILGAFLLLIKFHLIDRHLWRYLWPVLLIVLGLWIMFKPRAGKKS
ncbi:MAG: DUF5668 domain-containing protein [Candidatus Saccharicenans sp.]|nr:DUF5668 domain-containing protein [Candidatus Saccharicenans sp.]